MRACKRCLSSVVHRRFGMLLQGAGETGKAESYFCARMMRNPVVRPHAAQYLGEFVADASAGGFTKGTQWLVWKFESDSTMADAMQVWCLFLSPSRPFVSVDCGIEVTSVWKWTRKFSVILSGWE